MASRWRSKNDGSLNSTEMRELQNLCLENPIDLRMTVEIIKSDEVTKGQEGAFFQLNNEQLVHLNGCVNVGLKEAFCKFIKPQSKKCHTIIVVDRSGSMAGNPFNQVKMALEEIIGQVINAEDQTVDVILYDKTAVTVNYSSHDYKEAIKAIQVGGVTSFKSAFDETEAAIKRRRGEHFDETAVIFMTDGKDTVSSLSQVNNYSKTWKKNLQQLCENIIIHVIGFSKEHDLKFLQRISASGTVEGLYRYCEPSDGPAALREKLEELFGYVNWNDGYPIKFDLSLSNKQNCLILLESHCGQIDGSMKIVETEDRSDLEINGECWVAVQEPDDAPDMSVGIEIQFSKNRQKHCFRIPCNLVNKTKFLIEDEGKRSILKLSALSLKVDLLTNQVSKAVTDGNVDGQTLKKSLDHLQTALSKTPVFQPGHNKDTRAQILSFVKDLQAKLDVLHSMLAQHLRGETKDVSLLARAHDLRYQAKFSKARRQRLMDRRVAQNFNMVKSDAQKAQKISEEELSRLSKEAEEFYWCILSMMTVKDLLLDSSEMENAIGLGLAVSRPEHVLDNPTSLRIWSISGSLVSRSSLMDALEYKMGVGGPLAAHGGFTFDSSEYGNVSHATVGASREPINAWLPLFITPAHWTRVKSCLRQSLGYLCTLDPLGYDQKQLDIFFMVLGNMIGQLTEREAGENRLKLIYAMQRTCRACMDEFKMQEDILKKVGQFLESPMGRFKNEIPNIFTLIGYIVTLPVSEVRNLFKPYVNKTTHRRNHFTKLWLGVLAESLRRAVACSSLASDTKVISVLNLLLHGSQASDAGSKLPSTELTHLFSEYCRLMEMRQRDSHLEVPEYNPTEGMAAPEIVIEHSRKVDKAMDIVAQHASMNPEGRKGGAQITEANGIIKKWAEKVRECAGLPVGRNRQGNQDPVVDIVIETPPNSQGAVKAKAVLSQSRAEAHQAAPQKDDSLMTLITLNDTAKILTQLSQHCFPWLSSLPGCIAFLNYWLTKCDSFDQLDDSGALPANEWIQEIKNSVKEVYSRIKDFKTESAEKSAQFQGNDIGPRDGHDEGNSSPHSLRHKNAEEEEEDWDEDEESDVAWQPKRRRTEEPVTLPMILSALGLTDNQLQLIRAMLCQAISYSSNSQAREATEGGNFWDLTEDGNDGRYLLCVETSLEEKKEAARVKIAQAAAWKYANETMLRAETVWAFIGYLMKTYKDRGEGFKELINLIVNCPNAGKYPFLAEKVLVLLSGKFEGKSVFAKGNAWVPELKMSKLFEKVLGEEAWSNIERELLSNVHVHVYRESDIPNRHGHCNSYPYIPDRMRILMGLPLLKELPPNPNKGKRRR